MAVEKRAPRYVWLDEGLKVLEQEGPGALSIENLSSRTGKTKGSFYHHFKNREVYIEALLEYYGEITSMQLDDGDALEHLKKLTDHVFQIPGGLELAVRAWALYDPVVREFQDRMDHMRLEHLKKVHRKNFDDETLAELKAIKDYSIYIGLQQLRGHYKGENFKELLKWMYVS
ncbi:transcriptional regulator, TetR family [Desulfatibacillum alkenivorans DSM 16219]|jgi:AcrR family transcriptional regulator|uniref:Transcriptional regulator, TetR family n=1 Tax=Desulfatibacillum alkenivorans DSM 16219 TaxID=1121393 RepID=A0A1M6MRD3_9BACT|nr:TetR/AcrR family transcriptional regulator [Desulfatibacillum alkenivorans]SHJ85966.1 transcriptional regulator, TetR family [Desulfatibacillum alkenivorans DSM 16219]